MPSTGRVTFNLTNLTFSIAALLKGVSFVGGITLRGPINDPKDIITSWPQFEKIFGGLIPTSDFPLLCKRALERGAQLRVSSIRNYTDPADASTLTATKATTTAFANSTPANLFSLPIKYAGADYNNIRSAIEAATNGNALYFNLRIYHLNDPSLTETYQNLQAPLVAGAGPTVANSHYLDAVIRGSALVNVTYNDLSGIATQALLRPVNVVKVYSTGSNGSTVVAADYIGDAAGGTGLHSFNPYADAMQMGFPEISTAAIHTAGAAYADNRKDLQYFAHLDNSLVTATALNTERDSTAVNTMYAAFFAGGIKINDPITQAPKNISELGDVFGICAYSDSKEHEWFSFAGKNRGWVPNAIGVVNNFGSPALQADLELLANHQINMMIQADGQIYLSGNFSAQLINDAMSWNNAVRCIIHQKKSLGPALRRFLEEPTDFVTFKKIFREGAEPYLDMLVRERALFSYVWDGDQIASKLSELKVNNPIDIQNGKYKVRLFEKIIPSLNEITIDIIVSPLGVEFNILQQQTA